MTRTASDGPWALAIFSARAGAICLVYVPLYVPINVLPENTRINGTTATLPPERVITGTFWRNTSPGRDALQLPAKARASARYHRRGQAPPLYAASDRDASWGELFRHTDPSIVSPFEIRRRMSRLEVDRLPVLDLTDPDVRAVLHVTEAQLTSNDLRDCQRVADLVASEPARYGGILGPSASKPGETTLAVSQEWLERVSVVSRRTQTPPRRLVPLFEKIAETLPHREWRDAGRELARQLRPEPRSRRE